MLEQILALVKEKGSELNFSDYGIAPEQTEQVYAAATESITGEIQNVVENNGIEGIMQLFQGSNTAGENNGILGNPMVGGMIQKFIGTLTSKFNFQQGDADNIANNLIPGVLGDLIGKFTSGGFNIADLLKGFGGDKAGGFDIGDLLSKFTGGNKDGEGGNKDGGGITDMLKGFFR